MKKNMFFCIGAQKAGTTTLHDILSQNKDIAIPKEKETHFFSVEEVYNKDLSFYFNTFFNSKSLDDAKIIGEVDPSYCFFKGTANRISKLSSEHDIKFIFILRDPAKRAYSHYLMSKRRGYETLDFFEAASKEEQRLNKDNFSYINYSYVTRGYYTKQIESYLKFFPKENFLFLRFEEDFLKHTKQSIIQITKFLGLEPFEYDYNLKSNPASEPKNVLIRDLVFKDNIIKTALAKIIPLPQIKRRLKNKINALNLKEVKNPKLDSNELSTLYNKYFVEEINVLEKMINLDLSKWKHKN